MPRRLLLLLALTLPACGGDEADVSLRSSALDIEAEAEGAPADLALGADSNQFLGLIEPLRISRVDFEVPGRVKAVHVAIGDVVAEGQLLGELEIESRQAKLDDTLRLLRDARAARPSASRSSSDEQPSDWILDEAERIKGDADALKVRTSYERSSFQSTARREGERAAVERAVAMAASRGRSAPSTRAVRRAADDSLALALVDDLDQRARQLEFALTHSKLRSPMAGQVVNVLAVAGVDWNTRSVDAAFEIVDPTSFVVQIVIPSERARALAVDAEVVVELPALGTLPATRIPARFLFAGTDGVQFAGSEAGAWVPATFKLPTNPPRPLLFGEEVQVTLP